MDEKPKSRFTLENVANFLRNQNSKINLLFKQTDRIVKASNREIDWIKTETEISNDIFVKGTDSFCVFKAEPWARILYKHGLVDIKLSGFPSSKSKKVDYMVFEIWSHYFFGQMSWPVFCSKIKLSKNVKPENIRKKYYDLKETPLPLKIIGDLEKIYIDCRETEKTSIIKQNKKYFTIEKLEKIVFIIFKYSIIDPPYFPPYRVTGNPDFIYSLWQLFFSTYQWIEFAEYFEFENNEIIKNLPNRRNRKKLTKQIIDEISNYFEKNI